MNNSCKVVKRQFDWFKMKENYIRKIFAKHIMSKTKNILLSI